MEYDDLYDESPYVSKETPKRRGKMSMTRAILLICATILASVFGMTFYGYQQDQFVMNSNPNYVAIFDKKSKTLNVCTGNNCTLITPHFPNPESLPTAMVGKNEEGSFFSRLFNSHDEKEEGRRLLGTFPQPQQMQGNPQMMGRNPQMNPQMMQQMNPQMNPQMMQQMNPQMMQQMQQRGMIPQQMANPQMMQPQMVSATPQASNSAAQTENTKEDDAASSEAPATDDAAPDEGDEEAAPV